MLDIISTKIKPESVEELDILTVDLLLSIEYYQEVKSDKKKQFGGLIAKYEVTGVKTLNDKI